MSFRTITYGLTHRGETGFSANHDEPQMGALCNYRQTEMWANNKQPYFCTYAPNGVSIYPAQDGLPWKRREYYVTPPDFEGTRFRFTNDEMKGRTEQLATMRTSRDQGVRKSKGQAGSK